MAILCARPAHYWYAGDAELKDAGVGELGGRKMFQPKYGTSLSRC